MNKRLSILLTACMAAFCGQVWAQCAPSSLTYYFKNGGVTPNQFTKSSCSEKAPCDLPVFTAAHIKTASGFSKRSQFMLGPGTYGPNANQPTQLYGQQSVSTWDTGEKGRAIISGAFIAGHKNTICNLDIWNHGSVTFPYSAGGSSTSIYAAAQVPAKSKLILKGVNITVDSKSRSDEVTGTIVDGSLSVGHASTIHANGSGKTYGFVIGDSASGDFVSGVTVDVTGNDSSALTLGTWKSISASGTPPPECTVNNQSTPCTQGATAHPRASQPEPAQSNKREKISG